MVNLICGKESMGASNTEIITGCVLNSAAHALPQTNRNHQAPPERPPNMIHDNIRLSGLRVAMLLNHQLGLRQRLKNQEMSSRFWWEAFHRCHG